MAHTSVTKTHSQNTGAANTFSYSGSFDTFKESEVVVTLDAVTLTYQSGTINESASPREYTVDYPNKTIHIGGADLSAGTIIIKPVTDMGAPTARATYAAGSSITADDLNNNQKQLLRKAMEYDEQKLSSTGGTMTGDLTIGEDTKIIFEGATADAHETTLTVTDPTADRTITLPNVSGNVVTTGDTGTVATAMLADDCVTDGKLGDNAVNSWHYVDGSIDTEHIGNSQVTTAKIADANVTTAKLASNAVTTAKITDLNVTTAKIASTAITAGKIASSAVETAKINDHAVTTAKIADANVTEAKIASSAVTAAKIASSAVTTAKLYDEAVETAKIDDTAVTTAKLADSAVTTAKIAADAITGAKIADDAINSEHYTDGSIDTAHIADSQVTTAKIAADAITGAKIADDAIDSEHYTDGSIDTAHIGGTQVTDAKLASNSVTTAKITDANVTTAKIADDAITIAKVGCEQTTISDSDSHIPTSGAVVDYVAAQIAPIGGLEVIADEDNFPTTQPSAGVVISIADAGGVVFNGSGVSTTARTAGNGSDNVTINNAPSSLYSETLAAGVGMQVSSTGSSHTYNYHKILAKEADVKQLSDDINDFNSRYRIHAGEPSSNNDAGDLVYDTNADKMKVRNAANNAWNEVTSTGDFKYLVMTNAGTTNAATLNGSNVTFDLKETSTGGSAASVTSAAQLIVSVNGVVQKANTGTNPSGLDGFVMADADTITFCAAPASGDDIFIVQVGSAVSIPTPGDGTVSAAKIASGAVTTAKIADANVTTAKLASDAVTGAQIADDAVGAEHIEVLDSHLQLADSCNIKIGTGNDLQLYHDGTNSYIDSITGSLKIRSNNGNMAVFTPDGAVELYHNEVKKLETIATGVVITGSDDGDGGAKGDFKFFQADGTLKVMFDASAAALEFADSAKAVFGAGDDFSIYHDATNSFIKNTTGDFNILGNAIYLKNEDNDETYVKCIDNGAVELYHDNSKKLETTSGGAQVTGNMVADAFYLGDSEKLYCGAGDDLQIFHDGTNSFVLNNTGHLYVKNDNSNTDKKIFLQAKGDEHSVECVPDGGVLLYYDNSEKFKTTSGGAQVTGNIGDNSNKVTRIYSDFFVNREGSSNGVSQNEQEAIFVTGNLHFFHDNVTCSSANFSHGFTANRSYPTILIHQDGSGAAVHAEDGAITEASDYRIKENITTLGSAIDKVKTLKPITYTLKKSWKPNGKGEVYHGFVAHEVTESLPGITGIVCGEKDAMAPELYDTQDEIDGKIPEGKQVGDETGNMTSDMSIQGVDYGKLTPVLTAALKEAIAKIETLETKVAALEAG